MDKQREKQRLDEAHEVYMRHLVGVLAEVSQIRKDSPRAAKHAKFFADAPARIAAQRDALYQAHGLDALRHLDNVILTLGLMARVPVAETVKLTLHGAAVREGTRKPRGSRMPQLDAWLEETLEQYPTATATELWAMLPDGDYFGSLYRDGDSLVEVDHAGRERQIGFEGFRARVTKAKKNP